jgi:hypothetical protein
MMPDDAEFRHSVEPRIAICQNWRSLSHKKTRSRLTPRRAISDHAIAVWRNGERRDDGDQQSVGRTDLSLKGFGAAYKQLLGLVAG